MGIFQRLQRSAHRTIKRRGGVALLRSTGGDRECMMALAEYTTSEKRGELIQASDRVGVVSVFAPDGVTLIDIPDEETERVVRLHPDTNAEIDTLDIVAPPQPLEQNGIVVYWELQLRR